MTDAEHASLLGRLEARMDGLERDVARHAVELKEAEARLSARLDVLSERIGNIEKPLTEVNAGFKTLQRLGMFVLLFAAAVKTGDWASLKTALLGP